MININLKPEDIDKFVKDALMQSMIGEKISAAIAKATDEALNGYQSPVKQLVQESIKDQIRLILESDPCKQKIKDHILKNFTDELIDNILQISVNNAVRAIKDGY